MIDTRALAAITTALRNRLAHGLNQICPGTQVVTRPPDKMRPTQANQLNVFLFHFEPHAMWRNAALAAAGAANETRVWALKLRYLLTVYGSDDDAGPAAHLLLSEAMRLCEATPVLDSNLLRAAAPEQEFEPPARPVEIAPLALSVGEMAQLWNMFQVPYRLSAAYEVSVVLAENAFEKGAGSERAVNFSLENE